MNHTIPPSKSSKALAISSSTPSKPTSPQISTSKDLPPSATTLKLPPTKPYWPTILSTISYNSCKITSSVWPVTSPWRVKLKNCRQLSEVISNYSKKWRCIWSIWKASWSNMKIIFIICKKSLCIRAMTAFLVKLRLNWGKKKLVLWGTTNSSREICCRNSKNSKKKAVSLMKEWNSSTNWNISTLTLLKDQQISSKDHSN